MILSIFNSKKKLNKIIACIVYVSIFFIINNGLANIFEKLYLEDISDIYKSRYLFLGSSHTRAAIDAKYMSQLLSEPIAKIGLPGATTQDKKVLLEYYISNVVSPEIVFYEIGGLMFNETRFETGSYKSLYPLMDNPIIDQYIKSLVSSTDYYIEKYFKLLRYNGEPSERVLRSALGLRKDTFDNIIQDSDLEILRKLQNQFPVSKQYGDPVALNKFEATLDLAHRRGIKVVLVYIPEYYIIEKYFDYSEVYNRIRDIAKTYGAEILDINKLFQNDKRLFKDVDHLNSRGQKEFSSQMASYIKGIRAKQVSIALPSE